VGPMRVPKYYTQKMRILELIENAPPGTMLPTERELAERFETSRTTVRQALTELVVEGRLDRVQGRGNFVAEPKIVHVRQLTSFSEDLQGRTTTSDVLALTSEPASAEVATHLGVAVGATVHRVDRVRRIDGEPLARETAYLPGVLWGLADELEARGSLYQTLRGAYGVKIVGAEDEVETGLASPDEARILETEVGHPLLVVHRTAWDATGHVAEWTRSAFRGDRFRFQARIGTHPEPALEPATA
jgi:GntR family transcriptional regulator